MTRDADRLPKQRELGKCSRVEFEGVVLEGSRVREPRRERIANELAALADTLDGTLTFGITNAGDVRPLNRQAPVQPR